MINNGSMDAESDAICLLFYVTPVFSRLRTLSQYFVNNFGPREKQILALVVSLSTCQCTAQLSAQSINGILVIV